MDRLALSWRHEPTAVADRFVVAESFAAKLRQLGSANFMYSQGEALFVHRDRRKQQGGAIAPPGLHVLDRACKIDKGSAGSGGYARNAARKLPGPRRRISGLFGENLPQQVIDSDRHERRISLCESFQFSWVKAVCKGDVRPP